MLVKSTVPVFVFAVGVKAAVTVWLPAASAASAALVAHASGEGEQLPIVTADPKFAESIWNCTVPVGTTAPDAGAILDVKVTDWPTRDGFTDELTTLVVVTVASAVTTKLPEGVNETVLPQLPLAVVETVTVKLFVPAGVAPVVETVRVEVVAALVTVVGLNTPVAPVGSPLIDNVFVVQVLPLPVHVVLIV